MPRPATPREDARTTKQAARALAAAHEWVSIPDPDEDRTWLFDITFLTSNWTCIFGAGCQGVLTGPTPELVQGCCSYGAHFTDEQDVARVQAAAETLTPAQWQFHDRGWRPKGLSVVSRSKNGVATTRLVDDACIFLNRPGFEGGAGCALHRAAMERGIPHLELKPDVCWQLPLRRQDLVDEAGHVTSVISQWDRADWGEGGAEFAWWCTEAPEAFHAGSAVWQQMQAELRALVGPAVFELLAGYLQSREKQGTVLPHPTMRHKA